MRCLSKKILCYILIGLLTFSATSTVYYKSVHAMEWVGGALAFEEALKWLLAAIGITATAGMTDAYWNTYGDDFVDYAIENGATQTEVAEWQLKACQGIIDKGSVVWQRFKAWASDLVNGEDITAPAVGSSITDVINYLNTNYNMNWSFSSSTSCYGFIVNSDFIYLLVSNQDYTLTSSTNLSGTSTISYFYGRKSNNSFTYEITARNNLYVPADKSISSNINNISGINYNVIPYGSSSVADDNFESSLHNVDDLDVISSDGVDEDNPEVTVPMPGVSDSDNEVSKDAYQDIIDAINDGTITQEQGVEQIQEILKIITYDTVTDKVVPPQVDPETGEDKTKDDVLKENKENMGFTLGGLEAVFPFCIPFDIYAFMTLLVADPVCPEFDFPIKSVNGQVEEIHIDLEPFEPVAVVVRYCFDFLFIIGLAMLTRSLIGGGSSD